MKWIALAVGAVVAGLAAAIIFKSVENPDWSAETVQRLRQAAEQGDADAQYNLGYLYLHGAVVDEDHAAALLWFRRSAEQGFTDAHTALGIMYAEGAGTPMDLVKGYAWISIAAEQGGANARIVKDRLDGFLTQSQLAEARTLARSYRLRYVEPFR